MRMCSATTSMRLAMMIVLGALAISPRLTQASCRPSDADSAIDEAAAVSVEVIPQSDAPSPYYYEFGPWVFPPVLRVHEPPVPEKSQPDAPEPATLPDEPQH